MADELKMAGTGRAMFRANGSQIWSPVPVPAGATAVRVVAGAKPTFEAQVAGKWVVVGRAVV